MHPVDTLPKLNRAFGWQPMWSAVTRHSFLLRASLPNGSTPNRSSSAARREIQSGARPPHSKVLACLLVSCCLGASAAKAAIVWDGSGDPTAAGLAFHNPNDSLHIDHDHQGPRPGVLHLDTLASPALGGSVNLPPETAVAELSQERGWFVEARIDVQAHVRHSGGWDWYGAIICARDDHSNMIVSLRRDHSEVGPHGSACTPPDAGGTSHPLIEGYNTIRIERPAGSTMFHLYLNDVLVERTSGVPLDAGAVPNVTVGDGSSGSAGKLDCDYLAINGYVEGRPAVDPAEHVFFEEKIRPLLATHCHECHGENQQKGELRLDSLEALFRGGESGAPVAPGDAAASLLISAVRRESIEMPPEEPLTTEDIDLLVEWIERGAHWPKLAPALEHAANYAVRRLFEPEDLEHWAFQPPARPEVPSVNDTAWPRNPIDHFVLARLEQQGLRPSPRAEKLTLLRRVTYDLTGLPPTPEEIDAFLADEAPEAYVRVVDRLLLSRHFGEQWGRHWLDLARYSDAEGGGSNTPYPLAYRYRDYVIAVMNKDKPFDRFVHEQLAGDLLPASEDAEVEADRFLGTAMLALSPAVAEQKLDTVGSRILSATDQLDVVGQVFLGMSIGCARCHDHPYEPLPTEDFYSLAGIFASTHTAKPGVSNSLDDGKFLTQEVTSGEETFAVMTISDDEMRNVPVLLRGEPEMEGAEVPRRFPRVLAGLDNKLRNPAQSGRLELAHWLTDPEEGMGGLTARLIANRVWHWHLGVGLVADTSNFGRSAVEGPSHPFLLDWMAHFLMDNGWSLKTLHREILLSATYQQSSALAEESSADARIVDVTNRLLWRINRRRLEAEEVRDAILFVGGGLDMTAGGNLLLDVGINDTKMDLTDKDRLIAIAAAVPANMRRTIYLPVIRGDMHIVNMLETFDFPDRFQPAGQRLVSTTAPQSLYLMNNDGVNVESLRLAQTLLDLPDVADEDRITSLYKRLYGRLPSGEEIPAAIEYTQQMENRLTDPEQETNPRLLAWQSLVQAMFAANEFLYVE